VYCALIIGSTMPKSSGVPILMKYNVVEDPAFILTDVVHNPIQPQPHRPLQLTQLCQHQQLLPRQLKIADTQSSVKITSLWECMLTPSTVESTGDVQTMGWEESTTHARMTSCLTSSTWAVTLDT